MEFLGPKMGTPGNRCAPATPVKKADFLVSPDVPEWRERPDPERSILVHPGDPQPALPL
jgi:hypothetical protein